MEAMAKTTAMQTLCNNLLASQRGKEVELVRLLELNKSPDGAGLRSDLLHASKVEQVVLDECLKCVLLRVCRGERGRRSGGSPPCCVVAALQSIWRGGRPAA